MVSANDFEHKSELVSDCGLTDSASFKFTNTNKKHAIEVTHTPGLLEAVNGELVVEGEIQPVKDAWKGAATLNAGGYELGPLTGASEVSII